MVSLRKNKTKSNVLKLSNDLVDLKTIFQKNKKDNRFLTDEWCFRRDCFKLRYFLLNERFFQFIFFWRKKNDCFFIERRFYWTIVKWENEQNRRKINDNFKNKQNQFFEGFIKKSRNEKQTNAPISTHKKQEIKLIKL